jgi:uncharacterized membrane protein YagU involved in acid resistance
MNARRAAIAGVLGTLAMTMLFFLEPLLGLPKMSEGGILSTVMSASVAHLPVGFVGGWIIHFAAGIGLALLYAAVVQPRLPGPSVVRGMLYGALVFVGAQLVLMPLVGAGVFSRGDAGRLLGSLAGHLLYGGVVGWYVGRGVRT